ncbi:MAG TPA: SRPBCC family protein [Gemmatimonadales bacterium]|jgi:uncharacterized protein YndB with AHSA1/START domain
MATFPDPVSLRLERRLPGTIGQLWRYLTDSDLRARWLAAGPMLLVAGGAYEMTWDNAALSAPGDEPPERFQDYTPTLRGRVLQCEPPHRLSFSWGEGEHASEVTIQLQQVGEAVALELTHCALPFAALLVDAATGWHAHLDLLDDLLSHRAPRSFWRDWRELNHSYINLLTT